MELELPVPTSWEAFEDVCLVAAKLKYGDAEKNGRGGQDQAGVDIFSWDADHYVGIQCKRTRKFPEKTLTERDVLQAVARAEEFSPTLGHFILATTAPNDSVLQAAARRISDSRRMATDPAKRFAVEIWSWGRIQTLLKLSEPEVQRLFPANFVKLDLRPARIEIRIAGNGGLFSQFPDLLTPADSWSKLQEILAPLTGVERSQHLVSLSKAAVRATEYGEFEKFVATGDRLIELADTQAPIEVAGHYLRAEGLRLQADLALDSGARLSLQREAEDEYLFALRVNPMGVRALRGLGRVQEVQQALGEAIRSFDVAKNQALLQRSVTSPDSRRALDHEILRVTRHYVDCIVNIRNDNPQSEWNREYKRLELEGCISQCENLHREVLPTFQRHSRWFYFEWFSGYVFLSKAFGSIHEFDRMIHALTCALAARRHMFGSHDAFTAVELANLKWWLQAAKSQTYPPYHSPFVAALERFEEALFTESKAVVCQRIDDLVERRLPPWTN